MQQNAMENSGLRCWIKYCEEIMKPIEELMLNIKKDLKENLQLDANLSELPQNGGIYLEVGIVTEKNYIRNAQCKRTVPVLFMCKQADEPKAIETLEKICQHYRELKKPPAGKSYRAFSAGVTAGTHKTGRTEDLQVIYSAIIVYTIY